MTSTPLPPLARALSRLLPAAERQAIVGDLLEDADWRGLHGSRLTLSLCASCGAIAAGFAVDGARHALTPPAAGELAAGLAVEGGRMLRGMTFRAVVTRAIVFCTGVMLLAYAGELLIASLMNAAGFR
jgi:hypothetical protein